jgi:hypothetical protein
MDDSGFSRGYGFVKFGLEEEQKSALYEMNGYIGLGSKALKICSAVPKPKDGTAMPTQPTGNFIWLCQIYYDNFLFLATSIVQQAYDQYSQYYDQYSYYWQQQQNYSYDPAQQQQTMDPATYYSQQAQQQIAASQAHQQSSQYAAQHSYKYEQDDDYALVDYKTNIDVDKMNRDVMDRDRNFYDSLESSKWQPIEMLEMYWKVIAGF